jgi:hypothetical protein
LHDFVYTNLRRTPVVSRHAATHVAFGDDADRFQRRGILDDRSAPAS